MAAGVPLAFSVSYDLTTKVIFACIWVVPLLAAFAVVRRSATARLVVTTGVVRPTRTRCRWSATAASS